MTFTARSHRAVHRALRATLVSVALLAVTAAGCSNESPSPPVAAPTISTPPPTSSATPDEPAPLEVYRDYSAVLDKAYSDPSQDWTAEVERVAADPARFLILDELQNLRDSGIVYEGATQIDPEITSRIANQVVISDCLDISQVNVVQNGRTLEPAPDQLQRYRFDAVVALYDDPSRWLVTELQPKRGEPC